MNENNNVQDAQVVDEKPILHKDTVALGTLKTQLTDAKTDFQKQLAQVKENIATTEENLRKLHIHKNKLEGAIDAANIFLGQPTASK